MFVFAALLNMRGGGGGGRIQQHAVNISDNLEPRKHYFKRSSINEGSWRNVSSSLCQLVNGSREKDCIRTFSL